MHKNVHINTQSSCWRLVQDAQSFQAYPFLGKQLVLLWMPDFSLANVGLLGIHSKLLMRITKLRYLETVSAKGKKKNQNPTV